jgi:acyl-coenzyme A synthetase/AMP-(fatty) acid ligase
MWGPLVHGQVLRVIDDLIVADPAALHAEVVRERITHMGMTPGACRLLLPFLDSAGRGELRTLCLGGAAVDEQLPKALARHGIETWSFYGPTEATVWATCGRIEEDAPDAWIGVPFAGMRAYVLDDRLQWVPAHRTGDLYLAGPQVAQYPCDPALSAERFVPDPWHPGERMYRTSDRVRYTATTGLQFVGRDDRQVKINGYRVELDGLAALLRAEGLFDDVACAHGASDGLVAFYTTASGTPLERDTLERLAGRVLPAYVLPVRFEHRISMPLNRNSKHDLPALIASLAPAMPAHGDVIGERPWLEVILDFLRNELGLQSASPDSRFNELGAQSIALARLHAQLASSVTDLQLEELYVHPTPRSLALRLAYRSAPSLLNDEPPPVTRRRVRRRTPG